VKPGRIASIDAFRGITILAMIFVNEIAGVSGISPWLKHMPADADAMSLPDIVFPAFLFIVGMSIPFSIRARLDQGASAWDVQRHIAYRAVALVAMGVFMVNAEGGFHAPSMLLPIAPWSLLFYAAVYLVWGAFPVRRPAVIRGLRALGLLLLLVLAALYRGGDDGQAGMRPQWWGILGLIGWAYFFACEFYLLSRGRLWAVIGCLVLCVVYYVAVGRLALPSWLASLGPHAAHAQIVLAGVACAMIFFDGRGGESVAWRFAQAALFALALTAAATLLRPAFPISKIHATPSWCLYSAALCIAVFALLYGLIDVRGQARWTRLVEPAAASPLVAYLIPFVVAALLAWAGLQLPAVLHQGVVGLLWGAAYAALVLAAVAWLNRRGVRLKV
jgi:heparan-alpha-glucosaminide N-acetyltransferase